MYTSFEDISSKSRIWIYQANRSLAIDEVNSIEEAGLQFANTWEAHGKPLEASVKVFHSQFIVVAANEHYNMTTGCSIDASVGFIRKIASEYQIDLFDKTQVAFLNNNEVNLTPLKEIKANVADGIITADTFTFDNLVADKARFEQQWLTPAKNTWLARYF
jgi:hypothetical protein